MTTLKRMLCVKDMVVHIDLLTMKVAYNSVSCLSYLISSYWKFEVTCHTIYFILIFNFESFII